MSILTNCIDIVLSCVCNIHLIMFIVQYSTNEFHKFAQFSILETLMTKLNTVLVI